MLSTLALLEIAGTHDFATLIRVTRLEAILAVTQPKATDLEGRTSFEARVVKKFVKATGESSLVAIDTMNILLAAHAMERSAQRADLGSCVLLTLAECLAHQASKRAAASAA